MKPVDFPERVVIYAKDQPQYEPLPAHVSPDGIVTSCWRLDPLEIEMLIASGGKLWISVHTFRAPLQPILPSVFPPKFTVLHK